MTARAGSVVRLLDVNVLLALFHPSHIHHEVAQDWFTDYSEEGWATCPITENGFIRIASGLPSPEGRIRSSRLVEQLRKFCSSKRHQFWGDTVTLRDPAVFDLAFVGGPNQLTDIYLLGLAKKMGGRLVTFDRTIPLGAVVGATPKMLEVIATDE